MYLELALEFELPVRLAHHSAEAQAGFPLRSLAADEGVVSPDQSVRLQGADRRAAFGDLLDTMPEGVTELSLQPAIDTPELRALTTQADERVGDNDLLTGAEVSDLVQQAGVQLISWAALRNLQRFERRN